MAALGLDDRLRLALDGGAAVDTRLADGKTLLHRAIQCRRRETVRLLLDRGASVDLPWDGATYGPRAIHVAAMCGADPEILEALLDAGADLDEGMNGGTPLDWALRNDDQAAVERLRKLGAHTAVELGRLAVQPGFLTRRRIHTVYGDAMLLGAHRDQRVDSRRAPRRQEAREPRRSDQECHGEREGQRIRRANIVQ